MTAVTIWEGTSPMGVQARVVAAAVQEVDEPRLLVQMSQTDGSWRCVPREARVALLEVALVEVSMALGQARRVTERLADAG